MNAQTPHAATEFTHPVSRPDRWLIRFLQLVGTSALLAFGAAVMPEKWIVEVAEELGFDPFPHSPLTFYLARNLSLLYGFIGALLWIVTLDWQRYRPLVPWITWGTITFGVLQAIVDSQSSMPHWWTLGESCSTILGGLMLAAMDRWSRQAARLDSPTADARCVTSTAAID